MQIYFSCFNRKKKVWKDDTEGLVSEEGRLHAQENFLLSSEEAWSKSILLTWKATELVVWFHLYNNMNLPVVTK